LNRSVFIFVFTGFVQIFVRHVLYEIVDRKHQQVKHLEFMNGMSNLHQVQKILFGNHCSSIQASVLMSGLTLLYFSVYAVPVKFDRSEFIMKSAFCIKLDFKPRIFSVVLSLMETIVVSHIRLSLQKQISPPLTLPGLLTISEESVC